MIIEMRDEMKDMVGREEFLILVSNQETIKKDVSRFVNVNEMNSRFE
jgi:hypothetical protein